MRVLVIAPHPDDEVLGCGGTVAGHSARGDDVHLCIVTRAYTPDWPQAFLDRRETEIEEAAKKLGIVGTRCLGLPTVKLDTIPQKELNDLIGRVVSDVKPHVVYLPHKGDVNKDHRLVFDASMVALRPKPGGSVDRVLCYETLSETEWSDPSVENAFMPNVFVDISKTLEKKLDAMSAYGSELHADPHPRSLEAISALARVRGSTVGLAAAEAFVLVRELWRLR